MLLILLRDVEQISLHCEVASFVRLPTEVGGSLHELREGGQSRMSCAYDNNSGCLCLFPDIAQSNKPRAVTKFGPRIALFAARTPVMDN
jgi:hypothetical protein